MNSLSSRSLQNRNDIYIYLYVDINIIDKSIQFYLRIILGGSPMVKDSVLLYFPYSD